MRLRPIADSTVLAYFNNSAVSAQLTLALVNQFGLRSHLKFWYARYKVDDVQVRGVWVKGMRYDDVEEITSYVSAFKDGLIAANVVASEALEVP